MSSHDVVNKVRRLTGEKRVGHAGTLDPNATGLLIVGVGREYTKKLGDISKNTTKVYLATVSLGEEKDTDDSEGITTKKTKNITPPSEQKVKTVLESFKGNQNQTPPIFSSIKVNGKRAYKLAREGKKGNPNDK